MGGSNSTYTAMSPNVKKLHVAVMKNDIETVGNLINEGINVDVPWINVQTPSIKDGMTPLCQAVSLNYIKIVKKLIEANASLDKPDAFGLSPLHKAAYHGRINLIRLLIEAGANISGVDRNLNTPLHLCIENILAHNNVDTIRILIEEKAPVNMKNVNGEIPLHRSAYWCLEETTKMLLNAKSDVDSIDKNGKTPLNFCISAIDSSNNRKKDIFVQRLPVIKMLLEFGCDVLNLASWMWKNGITLENNYAGSDLMEWYTTSRPESLKHLCRVTIQKTLPNDSFISSLNSLPYPYILITYLSRKLL